MNACTIIAKNYVAQARVLARSYLEHHPGGRFWTLIIDEYDEHLDAAQEPFEILSPAEIGCDDFDEMAARYSVLELSTAVKPWLLRQLMGQTGEPITYLDPDIKVFSSLESLDRLAGAHGLVLTPHNLVPLPTDGHRPSQVDIMIAGVYNLGYVTIAPRPETERLLDWWAERLLRDCRVDPALGYFVDQRWFDLAPGFLEDLCILREPEYNVAYWNLPARRLEHDGERYLVEDRPLAFFHFSGFDPEQTTELSLHQDRIRLSEHPALNRICHEYAEETLAEDYRVARRWPYTYGYLPGAVRYDNTLRAMFIIGEQRGELTRSPLTPDGGQAFLQWLGTQQPGAPPGVHRLLAHMYGTQPELRQRFPDVSGADRQRLLDWARSEGAQDVPALAHLAPPSDDAPAEDSPVEAPPPVVAPASQQWGVNVVGYFRSELGVGEAARQMISALDAAGVPSLPLHGDTVPLSRQSHPYTQLHHGDAEYPVNLICMNADMLPEFARQAGDRFFAGRYSIGLWFWEVSTFRREWLPSFAPLDEVWLPTAHVAEAVAAVSPIPARTMRVPVMMAPIVPRSRQDLGLPGGFLFLFSFDYRSVFERKNPLAVIEAFTRAFPAGSGASLVIKSINHEADPVNHERLLAAVGDRPDIHVIDDYLSPQDKDTLTALCDCYVSLHRSEGFGYTMAEAMFCGKPVIATAYSGNLDFMTEENSLLVSHRLVPIGPLADPYPAEAVWAEPDVDHAAQLMRRVVEEPEFAAALGSRAAQSIHTTHSPNAAGEAIRRRLEDIRANRKYWRGEGPGPLVAPLIADRVAKGPWNSQDPRSSQPRQAYRRAVLRAMKPFIAYQQTFNADAARSLEALGTAVERVRSVQLRSGSEVMATLRRHETLQALAPIVESQSRTIDELKRGAGSGYETDRAVYLAVCELRRAHEAIGSDPRAEGAADELTPWELRGFSQNGEDGVLAEIFARVGAPSRWFVEFGIESGREGNSVFLADVAGWEGLFIEPEPAFFAALERKYLHNERVRTLQAAVTPENAQELFASAGVPSEPDLLSIDVDGPDFWIWQAISDFRPRVVVIEYNSVLDAHRRLVQPRDAPLWDGTDYYGASLGAIRALGEQKGYRLVHTELSGVNAFFVRADLAEGRFPAPEEVPLRGGPNYFQSGYSHPPDPHGRTYLELEPDGSLTPSVRATSDTNGGATNPSAVAR